MAPLPEHIKETINLITRSRTTEVGMHLRQRVRVASWRATQRTAHSGAALAVRMPPIRAVRRRSGAFSPHSYFFLPGVLSEILVSWFSLLGNPGSLAS